MARQNCSMLLLLLLFCIDAATVPPPLPRQWIQQQHSSLLPRQGVIRPTDFGADPTGHNDSRVALQKAITTAFNQTVPGNFIGNSSSLGGVVIDLAGGEYVTSMPLWLGKGGNVRFCCGSLRAAPTFPVDGFLINGQQNEDITFENMLFDCARTGGGLHFNNPLRVNLDKLYVVHYATAGIQVVQGHEVHLHSSWLGEWIWSDAGGRVNQNLTGTAVLIDGQVLSSSRSKWS
jgi:hypothetical protein